ncbi:hypothetical protein ABAC460_08420 [Asticcacaulis sp. AC460]|uniref:hypothetical protein n=1 Tax=Asticcacaulis sp. AC460 TaxID=1282360 RepID=UPI0003C3C7F1|nr:hypothetical protein [Asticcacaulis sp. AC460]ESQ90843.1 hypothetical protein ABAC460_08420 [Asticcacaulis sp. AC460]
MPLFAGYSDGMKLVGCFLALGLIATPILADEVSSDDARIEVSKQDKKLISVVEDYVTNSRGWDSGDYTVQFYRHEDDMVVFSVWYESGDSARTLVYNNARSFRAVVNPKTKKVESERFF